jgi:hypothetical protein
MERNHRLAALELPGYFGLISLAFQKSDLNAACPPAL